MITNGIIFKNFLIKKKFKQVSKDLNHILKKKNQVIQSLSGSYKNSFDIKAKYGPLGDSSNTTYFTNGTLGEAGTVTGSSNTPTASDGYATTTAPLTTFYGDNGAEICSATAEESVTGGTIRAYLLDSSGTLIADDSSVEECSGVTKLLGIMQLDTKVNITESTSSVKTIFKVENNGTSVVYDDVADGIRFDSGPFSVSFETTEETSE